MSIPATQLRPGMIIKHNNDLHSVFSVEHRTPGNLRAFIQAKLRNLRTGAMFEHRFRSPDPIEKITVDEVEMEFLSNNLEWSATSLVELYRCRWQIEVFFKQIKQTLQLADFLGTSANAVRWQVWTALLVYLLLRYLAFLSNWSHSFSRLFTVLRAALWKKWDGLSLLRCYGTAGGHFRYLASPAQAYLPTLG